MMYVKFFKNKVINRWSWLTAKRSMFKIEDGKVVLGKTKLTPSGISAIEKNSWFTKNYFIVTFTSNDNHYVVSLTNNYMKQLTNFFEVQSYQTDKNIGQNLFFTILIVSIFYNCYYLLVTFLNF